jgi:cysteine desulfuration protein SufE
MMTITDIQQEIIEEFEILAGDRESTIFYIMELGQRLPSLESQFQIEENLIKGCQSKVWLVSDFRDGKVYFRADSNTEITKGLISLLIRILSERTPEEIVQSDLFFLQKIGMNGIIGSQRSNGLASMIKQMKLYAIAFQQLIQK